MRIITGSARGTRLKSPVGVGTRPTADRTREALFSMLGTRVMEENMRRTKMESRAVIRRGDVYGQLAALSQEGHAFDLIFADPPYESGDNTRVLWAVEEGRILAAEGLLILEQGAEEPLIDHAGSFSLLRERRYGAARLCFYTEEVQG